MHLTTKRMVPFWEQVKRVSSFSSPCVLCGHNGSRYGTFFTPLSQISIGDEIMITDKNGLKHIYEVTETEIVNPYDNSIKTQLPLSPIPAVSSI